MIQALDTVVLTCNLPKLGLKRGEAGTVVLVHEGGAGYEVEFLTLSGETVAVTTLTKDQVRPAARGEIAHVRAMA